ncbi:hypothetical protein N7468_008402 [Penicillium chermesinum]|uniref:Uncharacterized protein n=1 Tax=Penicillium chermesinum TaxID=63820 RepID=A0A9W9NPU1_9EURO|nr:uncharacterized protein N7468_008402 [Penicillium chermesinum]KAJ5223860.1 hypothetical protein N7468_008402 [Penicillium chermesinum]KAJ6155313.1 hypothetical protein N7470_005879 [Penicillium chermesinum]
MPPDINSLPPSRSSSSSSSLPHRNLPALSPGTAPAPGNPSTSHRRSRVSSTGQGSVSERRRSITSMNLNQNEAAGSGAGNQGESPWSDHRSSIGQAYRTASPTSHASSPIFATADPHHQRAPSLGEIHQELEQEQEAQVNRLLQMIRSQQAQLNQLQQNQQQSATNTAVVDDNAPAERSPSFSLPMPPPVPHGSRLSISSLSNRRSSRPSSQAASPNLRPQDASRQSEGTESFPVLRDSTSRRGSRDEGAYYQAEAAMLSRENQMLRQRVRELERQIADLTTSPRPAPSPPVAASSHAREGAETVDPQPLRSADGKD